MLLEICMSIFRKSFDKEINVVEDSSELITALSKSDDNIGFVMF